MEFGVAITGVAEEKTSKNHRRINVFFSTYDLLFLFENILKMIMSQSAENNRRISRAVADKQAKSTKANKDARHDFTLLK